MLQKMTKSVFKEKNVEIPPVTYEVGSIVKETGHYICVPCGYKRYLEKGQKFPDCLKCMGKRLFKKGLETWEKVKNL